MNQEVASFYATITANSSGLQKGLNDARSSLDSLKSGFGQLENFVATTMLAVGAAVVGAGAAVAVTGFQFDAMKEQSQIAFTTMLGSSQAAQAKLEELQAFAAKTPFEFPDLIRASQRMMAMGFQAQEVIPTLTAVGDAVAALGGGQFEIDRVTTALGQMNAKGKTSAEEMMQLTEAGIPAWQMLADKIGVTVPEAMKMVTKGAVDARTTITAVTEGIEARFGGMMAAQSLTFTGLLSNLKDNFTQLSGQVMQPFFELAKAGLAKIVEITSSPAFVQGIKDFTAWGKQAAQQIAAFVTQGIEWGQKVLPPLWEKLLQVGSAIRLLTKPITDTIAKFVRWKDIAIAVGAVVVAAIGSIVASFAPVIAGAALLIAGIAALRWAWENDFGRIRTDTLNTVQKITDWFYKESGIWKGTWEKTGEYILDRVTHFFKYGIYNMTVGTWSSIRENLKIQWNIIKNRATEWAQDVYNTISTWVNDTIRDILNFKDRVLGAFHAWIDPIAKDISDWIGTTRGHFENWYGWIVGDFGVLTKLKKNVLAIFDAILKWWDDNIQPWIDKGKRAMQNLWDGIKEIWNKFIDWWNKKWGNDVPKTIDVKMEMHSPSKVMMEKGYNAMKGFAIGADKAMPMVYDAMTGMSTASMGAGSYAYSSGSGTSEEAALLQRNNDLLAMLIQVMRDKNMTVNVAAGGGSSGGSLAGFTAGGRR